MNREERRRLKKIAKRDSKKLNETPEFIENRILEMEEIISLQGKPIEQVMEFVEKFNKNNDFRFDKKAKEFMANYIQKNGSLPDFNEIPDELTDEDKAMMKQMEEEELKINTDLPVYVLQQKLADNFIRFYNSEISYKDELPKGIKTEGYIVSKLDYLLKVEENFRENMKEQLSERQKDIIRDAKSINNPREVIDKLLEEWSDIKIYYKITEDESLELEFYGKNNQLLGNSKSYGKDKKVKEDIKNKENLLASEEIKRPRVITNDFNYEIPLEKLLAKVIELLFGLTVCTLWTITLDNPKKLESKSISGKVSNTIYNEIKYNKVFNLNNQLTLEKLKTLLEEQN